jgi:hypothetical protein
MNPIFKEQDLDWIKPYAELITDGKVMCDYEED